MVSAAMLAPTSASISAPVFPVTLTSHSTTNGCVAVDDETPDCVSASSLFAGRITTRHPSTSSWWQNGISELVCFTAVVPACAKGHAACVGGTYARTNSCVHARTHARTHVCTHAHARTRARGPVRHQTTNYHYEMKHHVVHEFFGIGTARRIRTQTELRSRLAEPTYYLR